MCKECVGCRERYSDRKSFSGCLIVLFGDNAKIATLFKPEPERKLTANYDLKKNKKKISSNFTILTPGKKASF